MKFLLLALLFALPNLLPAIGAAADTPWPDGARVEVQLKLTPGPGKDGKPRVSGDLTITNPTEAVLTVQSPDNRLVLAFLVLDELGNPVAPAFLAKIDPSVETISLAPRATHSHHFDKLEFITGSALLGYELKAGKKYRVIAVYRPAGPNGPGFASQEAALQLPQ